MRRECGMSHFEKKVIPVSLFQLFSIGIGPSSSHTVGPMRAAFSFVSLLEKEGNLERTCRISVELFGSLAMTGMGHATDIAVLLGLSGEKPELTDPDTVSLKIEEIKKNNSLKLLGKCQIKFNFDKDLLFLKGKRLPFHSNAMKCKAFDFEGKEILSKIFYSVGGGFVLDHEEALSSHKTSEKEEVTVPYPFHTGNQLLNHCKETGLSIHEIMLENEKSWRSEEEHIKGSS